MKRLEQSEIEELLTAVGEVLRASGSRIGIVVVGGATLSLLGWVPRTTTDVDVIATATESEEGRRVLQPPDPFPSELEAAIARVARDFGLPPDWMNAAIGAQWRLGSLEELLTDLEWRSYGGLDVGLAGRQTLITLKLYAAVDQGPNSVHYQDLIAISPKIAELREAAEWVRSQDAGAAFSRLVDEVLDRVKTDIEPIR